ncbi:MAG: HisA/HisF-related TIM barrel protein, partial [Acidimicrobiales bacterium]
MQLYAAVDLLAGRSVRLLRGDFAEVSDYGEPLAAAQRLAAGAPAWLHVVDLQAA